MKVEVFSDIVCPWCYIGERRFTRALEEFEGADDVEVIFRPFQLDPDAPAPGVPLREHLEGRYGPQAGQMMEQAGAAARGEGISMNWTEARATNTFHAHRLMRFALDDGGAEAQRGLAEALFAAHFTHGQDVGDLEVLAECWRGAGLELERARAFLASEEGVVETRTELEEARRIGVRSVPTFLFEGQWAVQGAQPPELFLQALRQVAEG